MIISLVMPATPAGSAERLACFDRLVAAPREREADHREHRHDAAQHDCRDGEFHFGEPDWLRLRAAGYRDARLNPEIPAACGQKPAA
jgi:hypothetical protein